MGGGRPRSSTSDRAHASPPLRHSCVGRNQRAEPPLPPIPACAGMTERAAGMAELRAGTAVPAGAPPQATEAQHDRRSQLATSHPPPNLPPKRESPAKWQIWGLHEGVDQIGPDRRIRRNWAFCRRLLKGGRDELGKGREGGAGVGGLGAPVPAYAGMTKLAAGMAERSAGMTVGAARAPSQAIAFCRDRLRPLVTSHPPPNLPPKRGEG